MTINGKKFDWLDVLVLALMVSRLYVSIQSCGMRHPVSGETLGNGIT